MCALKLREEMHVLKLTSNVCIETLLKHMCRPSTDQSPIEKCQECTQPMRVRRARSQALMKRGRTQADARTLVLGGGLFDFLYLLWKLILLTLCSTTLLVYHIFTHIL